MTLISRQINIATNLLNNPQIYKVKDLSKKYKVSVRTLRNDLNKIAEWIRKQPGCQYNSKPGKGIWISFASDFNRKDAIDSLQSFATEENVISRYLDPTQRKWKILTELVFSDGYLTGKELAKSLNVSTNTFLSDLTSAKKEAEKFNLTLASKNYYGYTLEGNEISLRGLMEYTLQNQLNKYSYGANNLMDMISKIITKSVVNEYLPRKINKLINYIALILADQLSLKGSPSSGLDLSVTKSMINRLTIIIFENTRDRNLTIYSNFKKVSSTQKWYVRIYHLVMKTFQIRPTPDEERYFIFGVKVLEKDVETNTAVEEIIAYVSDKLDLPLVNDIQLKDSLIQHLMSELNSNYQHFHDYTPFTEEVKSRFGDLFTAVKEALEIYISKNPLIIGDTFATLVSLHFLVSISDMKKIPQICALYVCSTGLGATRLLEKTIQGRIPYITSVGFASVANYRLKIQELKPDLVISIFPLEKVEKIPIVQVNPIPNERDLKVIEERISLIVKNSTVQNGIPLQNTLKRENSISTTEKVLSLSLEAFVDVSEYFANRVSKKYEKAFMIHVQLATERIYFGKQYDIKLSEKQISKFRSEDINKLKKIYRDLDLEINISEAVAILRYTLLK